MNTPHASSSRLAGLVLIVGALGFVAVFSYLASQLGYPEVLDHPAAETLPALLAGGVAMRTAWTIYALLPFSIVLAALLAHDTLRLAPAARRLVTAAGVLAGLAMAVGLARWPTLQWTLARAWVATSDPATRASLAAIFDAANVALGNVVGEWVGEVALSGWFVGVGLSMRGTWVGRATLGLSVLMAVGSFRNLIPETQGVTDLTNNLLPLVLIAVGLSWVKIEAPRGLMARWSAS